jgi:CheY-like chemotaxis protein
MPHIHILGSLLVYSPCSGNHCAKRQPPPMARALRVLLIDDNENDTALILLAAETLEGGHTISSVDRAVKAIELLKEMDRKKLPLPDLLLLDLRMPEMDGFQFLGWLRAQPKFDDIPAIVLSGSILKDDIASAYRLGAQGYMIKPAGLDELIRTLKSLLAFWSACEVPNGRVQNRTDLD